MHACGAFFLTISVAPQHKSDALHHIFFVSVVCVKAHKKRNRTFLKNDEFVYGFNRMSFFVTAIFTYHRKILITSLKSILPTNDTKLEYGLTNKENARIFVACAPNAPCKFDSTKVHYILRGILICRHTGVFILVLSTCVAYKYSIASYFMRHRLESIAFMKCMWSQCYIVATRSGSRKRKMSTVW